MFSSNELELIRFCARLGEDADSEERLRRLWKAVDTEQLAHLSVRHGLVGLVYRRVSQALGASVSPEDLAPIRSAFYAGARAFSQVTGELGDLLQALESAGVVVVPLKGVSIAEAAYDDPTLRAHGDIDVLLKRRDIPIAREYLVEQGYETEIQLEEEAGYLDSQLGYEFVKGSLTVELHWSFIPRTLGIALDVDASFASLERVTVAGHPTFALAFPDRILFLAAHGGKHCWDTLKWIRDVAGLIEMTPHPDWEAVLVRARESHSERILLLGLHLAASVFDAQLPAEVVNRIQADPKVEKLAQDVVNKFVLEDLDCEDENARALFRLALRTRMADKLPYFVHLIQLATKPTERDEQALSLPRGLRFLYPAVRTVRISREFGAEAIRHFGRILRSTLSSR